MMGDFGDRNPVTLLFADAERGRLVGQCRWSLVYPSWLFGVRSAKLLRRWLTRRWLIGELMWACSRRWTQWHHMMLQLRSIKQPPSLKLRQQAQIPSLTLFSRRSKLQKLVSSCVLSLVFLCLYQCSGWRHYVFRLFVCLWVCLCIPNSVVTQYLEKYWMYFHQTFIIGACWDKEERLRFWVQKGQNSRSWWCPKCWKMHFLALWVWYLKNQWTEFTKLWLLVYLRQKVNVRFWR